MKQLAKNEAKDAFLQTRAQVSRAACGTWADRASQRGASLAQKPGGWEVSQAGLMAQEKAWEESCSSSVLGRDSMPCFRGERVQVMKPALSLGAPLR